MSKPAIDLQRLVARREQLAYEHHLARRTYAYGVDLRRAAWLDQSTLGEPLMRGVDRRWAALLEQLSAQDLQPPNTAAPTDVLERLSRLVRLLHAPVPSVRLLRRGAGWPIVTPLGTTKGGSHLLLLDIDRLRALPDDQQTFLLASGLANLQCGHGSLYAAHLMAHRRTRGMGILARILSVWSKVTVFSADRAGLVALGDLEPTLEAVRAHADPGVAWYPKLPEAAVRIRALQDFDRSRLMAGLRLNPNRSQWSLAPVAPTKAGDPKEPAANDAPGDKEEASQQAPHDPPREPPREPPDDQAGDRTGDPDDAVASAERQAERINADRADAEERAKEAEELLRRAKEIGATIANAWPVARCDARLTRRLGLL